MCLLDDSNILCFDGTLFSVSRQISKVVVSRAVVLGICWKKKTAECLTVNLSYSEKQPVNNLQHVFRVALKSQEIH